ncbi:transcriptional regulator [Alginatibacterium sediminis]|uniref:Transcriptional regulator n=1 Tax=Alginatibacterium sediminis TaxID=2164068 RepID=A0A420EHG3_9ALTE|nr:helix-turn-helix domain-containing protein [Alginatibacterium sediminis]RKF20108.1 transcriptional regulator [Alginatibacterium sediminis]
MTYKQCPLEKMFEMIGGKWKLIIIFNLRNQQSIRFNQLNKSIQGISQKVLTSQLRELEKDDFVVRKVFPEVPPRVEYSLSKRAHSLYPVLDSLSEWAAINIQNKD